MQTLFLYEAEGCDSTCLDGAQQRFQDQCDVIRVDASTIKRDLQRYAHGICFPGGNATQQGQSLRQQAETVRSFVDRGGTFWGFCAGSYLASSGWQLRLGEITLTHEDVNARLLKLIPGKILGPINQHAAEPGFLGAEAVGITSPEQLNVVAAGCGSLPEPTSRGQVFARYAEDGLPAIASYRYGQGTVLLAGPHIELNCDQIPDLNPTENWEGVREDEERVAKLFTRIYQDLQESQHSSSAAPSS